MQQTVLILGATGRFGRHSETAFRSAGWSVRTFRRGDDLTEAARGVDVIVNGWNPPYPQWKAQVPGLTAQVIEAARGSGATVVIPGNLYVFGADMPGLLSHHTPHRAVNPLGRVRREMEDAYRNSGVPTIVLRAGDFLDTEPSGNWFDAMIVKSVPRGRMLYPGRIDIPHAWAFLPDMAAALVGLAERRADLPRFADIGFPGYTLTGTELRTAIEQVLGQGVRLRRMSWLPLQLARPFWPMASGLLEMRYLWDTPHSLDGTALDRILPDRQHTPLAEALRLSLAHIERQRDIDPDQPVRGRGGHGGVVPGPVNGTAYHVKCA